MRNRAFWSRLTTLGFLCLAAVGAVLGTSQKAQADLTQRYATDDRANFILFGNTTGLDCRDSAQEKPIVGTVPLGPLGLFNCRGLLPDGTRGDDVLWRSDEPTNGRALASPLITPAAARSTAVLKLPAGAQVLYARLYWAAQRIPLLGAGTVVGVERPGVFATPVQADALRGSSTFPLGLLTYYQSSADITRLVQQYGSGAYRISSIDTVELALQQIDTLFIGWNIVVFYRLGTEPPRNLTLFDGFDRLASPGTDKSTLTVNNITAATAGVSAQVGVVAYGANSDIVGDQLLVNTTAITNGYNPANNFFNRSSTVLGALGPQTGDLPQFSGRPGSISGLDIDVVDVSAAIPNGSASFTVTANTTKDLYFLGSVATAVGTIRPVLSNTTKTVTEFNDTDGVYLPGDILEYTISTQNTGNAVGTNVIVTDVLPAKVTYVAGSLEILSGPNMGPLSDGMGDDQGEYDMNSRTVTVRLGTGANMTSGGSLAIGATTSFRFRARINAGVTGTISNQASISATTAGSTTPMTWPTGNGMQPGQPTVITVTTCANNSDCSPQAPYCNTTASPPRCICRDNNDCPGGLCNPLTQQCVECLPGMTGNCNPGTVGGACLPTLMCGCLTSADCNGRMCNVLTGMCAAVNTDLGLSLTRTPPGMLVPPGTPLTYQLTVTNKGAAPITGAQLNTTLSPTMGLSWTCTATGTAQCPKSSGTESLLTLPSLPSNGSLVFTYTTTASTDPASSALDFVSTITPPRGYNDSNPTDNTVADSVLIGIPPLGPDLSVTVDEQKSPNDPSVTYTINVTNNGPGQAPGATVTYQIPPNTTVDILGGDGWICTQQDTLVVCTSTKPIDQGQTSTIQVVTHATGGQSTIPLLVEVTGTDGNGNPLTDPKPEDNKVDRITDLDRFYLFGGGLSCSLAPGSQLSSTAAPAMMLLMAMMLLAWRRRRVRA